MKAAQWIDRVRSARGWDSDYRAAKELGLSRNAISNYRNRTPTLDDETALKVAEALNLEPAVVVLDQVVERTKSERVRGSLVNLLDLVLQPRQGGGGGGGRVDITSSAQLAADPARGGAPGVRKRGIRIASTRPVDSLRVLLSSLTRIKRHTVLVHA